MTTGLSAKSVDSYFARRRPAPVSTPDWSMTAHFKRLEAVAAADLIRAYQNALNFGRDQSGAPMSAADRAWLTARRDALIAEQQEMSNDQRRTPALNSNRDRS